MLIQSKMPTAIARQNRNTHKGFTLIELMVTVAIISILATIAIPSYRNQVRQNAEHQAKARALTISNQLSSWRSKRLSYSGFIPRNSGCTNGDFCYSNATTGAVFVPLGSTNTTHKYVITIVDAQPVVNGNNERTAVPLTDDDAGGKGWRMLVEPNSSDSIVGSAHSYYLDSLGQRCEYDNGISPPNLSASAIQCTGTGVSTW